MNEGDVPTQWRRPRNSLNEIWMSLRYEWAKKNHESSARQRASPHSNRRGVMILFFHNLTTEDKKTAARIELLRTQGWAGPRSRSHCTSWLHNFLLPSGRGWINISGVEHVGPRSTPSDSDFRAGFVISVDETPLHPLSSSSFPSWFLSYFHFILFLPCLSHSLLIPISVFTFFAFRLKVSFSLFRQSDLPVSFHPPFPSSVFSSSYFTFRPLLLCNLRSDTTLVSYIAS